MLPVLELVGTVLTAHRYATIIEWRLAYPGELAYVGSPGSGVPDN